MPPTPELTSNGNLWSFVMRGWKLAQREVEFNWDGKSPVGNDAEINRDLKESGWR
jgi:hypothetical protein